MTDIKKRLPKTTKAQYEELLHFLSANKMIVRGKTSPNESIKIEHLWKEFIANINAKGMGPQKSVQQWKNIFREWKQNTKRKSRLIQQSMNATGGGPNNQKVLTDLEEKLLSIISKIHLGDEMILDSFPTSSTVSHEVENNNENNQECRIEENLIDDASCHASDNFIAIEYEENKQENNSFVEPQWKDSTSRPKQPTKPTKANTQVNSRYTSNLLQEACSKFCEAQEIAISQTELNVAGMNNLAKAIENFACMFKEIENKKLKVEYFKLFNTFDGFEDL